MKFKKLELQSESKGLFSFVHSQHFRKTVISILIGAIAGFGFFYLSEGMNMDGMIFQDYARSILIGGFLGFFITNSPCARNQC
ncbi:MAG: hypothetical protein ACFCUM_17565 [Bacteroidales bacterium]|jgi:hypothetical protein